jgi:signal transduction histidine kinase
MIADLILYLELLVFLCGTFLYGFFARELVRDRSVLAGNRAMRMLALALLLWYAGCLVDSILGILAGETWGARSAATAFDLGRGLAWLVSFPLLAHALWRLVPHRPSGAWLLPGYATLLLFAPAAARAWSERAVGLAEVAREAFPIFLVHSTLSAVIAAAMIGLALGATDDPSLRRFLRALLGALLAVVGCNTVAALVLRLGGGQPWVRETWLLLSLASGLAPGITFLYHVQRYNLLRLSLSWRSLRHFASVGLVLVLVMVAGPAAGAGGSEVFRRFIAWSLVIALVAGTFGGRILDALAARWGWLKRLLGRSVTPAAMDALARRIHQLDAGEDETRAVVSAELSRWLDTRARWLERPGTGAAANDDAAPLWRALAVAGARGFTRVDAPGPDLGRWLGRAELHGVFPLRVDGALEAVLALEVSPNGGGYRDGEIEAVHLVLGQLATALELRRALAERVAAERRLGEHERLSLLGLVAASLAHELKNPLAAMKALAQTVAEELRAGGATATQARDLGVIVEQIEVLNGVAREILEFARPREGSAADLAALVRSAAYVLGQEAKRKGVTIDTTAVVDLGAVRGSPATWQTVAFNLMLNAVHHAPPGSPVIVRLGREDGGVRFETENGGPELPGAVSRELFAPFVTTRVAGGGTGLGLHLVARRLDELGGTIELVNHPDQIVFRVRVPG